MTNKELEDAIFSICNKLVAFYKEQTELHEVKTVEEAFTITLGSIIAYLSVVSQSLDVEDDHLIEMITVGLSELKNLTTETEEMPYGTTIH